MRERVLVEMKHKKENNRQQAIATGGTRLERKHKRKRGSKTESEKGNKQK